MELKGKYSEKNEAYIKDLNPAVRDKFREFINDIEAMGFTVMGTSGYRSFQKQAVLKKEDSRNASPGYSPHNYGIALDFVLYKNGKMIGKADIDGWKKSGVVELAKNKYGMRWGGEFPGYPDGVHFDYANLYPTNKLYAMAVKQFGSVENAKGNEIKLA